MKEEEGMRVESDSSFLKKMEREGGREGGKIVTTFFPVR
jgi:hypothetical protein